MGYPGSKLEDYFPTELIKEATHQVKKGEIGDHPRELVRAFHELRDALIKHFANTGTQIT